MEAAFYGSIHYNRTVMANEYDDGMCFALTEISHTFLGRMQNGVLQSWWTTTVVPLTYSY